MHTFSSFLSPLVDGRGACRRAWVAALILALLPVVSAHSQNLVTDAQNLVADAQTLVGDGQTLVGDASNIPEVDPELIYLPLGPTFISNYDGGARLKYLQTDVSVRVHAAMEEAVLFHLPAIRNRLVVLFSAQLEENLTSTQGREALRRQALEEVREVLRTLESEDHSAQVADLYFTTFVVQG